MKKILSIDGGGIRGIIPAMLLAEIEKQTGKPIAQLFDLVVGTSTGGILALGLAKPHPKDAKVPEYTAKELIQLYKEKGSTIFSTSLWDKMTNISGLADQIYDASGIESVLKSYFADTELKDALIPIMISAYNIESRSAWFFNSVRAQTVPEYNFFMRDVARSTSAAPTYFEPAQIKNIEKNELREHHALIDGGVFANNPAMCAYAQAHKFFPDENNFMIVSLGTGSQFKPIYYESAKKWGKIGWAGPIIDILFDGSSSTVDYQLEMLLNSRNEEKRYFRFDQALDDKHNNLDDATEKNIQYLIEFSDRLINNYNDELSVVAEKLTKA